MIELNPYIPSEIHQETQKTCKYTIFLKPGWHEADNFRFSYLDLDLSNQNLCIVFNNHFNHQIKVI
jgi:hypothetical protein